MYNNNNLDFINECLLTLFNAATTTLGRTKPHDIVKSVDIKRLRETLKENGVTFNVFIDDQRMPISGEFDEKSIARHAMYYQTNPRLYMKKKFNFPFSEEEFQIVESEYKKLKEEEEKEEKPTLTINGVTHELVSDTERTAGCYSHCSLYKRCRGRSLHYSQMAYNLRKNPILMHFVRNRQS